MIDGSGKNIGIRREGQKVIGIDASRANAAGRTGVEWYAYHVIQELKAVIPADCRVILYSREPLRDSLENLPPNWESCVLTWPPFARRASTFAKAPADKSGGKPLRLPSWRFWTQIRFSWEMLRRPPDILFVPAHALPLVLPPAAVTTIHDVAFRARPEVYGFFERSYQRLTTAFAVRRCAKLLTVSEFSKVEIVKYFAADPAKIAVTPLGCDRALYRPVGDCREMAVVLGRSGLKPPYFLFVGRLEAKKNLGGLLRAFQIFLEKHDAGRGYKLVLVGKRGAGFEEAWAGLSGRVRERVVEAGYIRPEDSRFFYAGAAALVFVSWYEGFGLPLIEAFACGTPVIASRAASIPEVAGDAALYVDPARPDDIAAAMRRLADDPALARELSAKGAARLAAGGFSWRRTAELTWRALADAMEKKG